MKALPLRPLRGSCVSLPIELRLNSYKSGKTAQAVAAENGISPSQVSKWKQQLLDGGFSKELKRIQKENEILTRQLAEAQRVIGKKDLMLEIMKKN